MDTTRPTAELVLQGKLNQGMSYEEARKATIDLLQGAMPDIRMVMDEMHSSREEEIRSRTKLTEIGTARHQDFMEMGWYTGVDDSSGVWGQLRRRMLAGGLAPAVPEIHASTEEILASIAEPMVNDDKRLGLVIGNVQSGKTANFSAVIAKALDSRYKFVLVLSGIHNNLRKQTQERLEEDLGLSDEPHHWYKLTDVNGDFGTAHKGNAAGIVTKHDRILAVVKKNSTRLRNVLDFLESLDSATLRETPFLLIDDESDQATPDSSADIDDEPTAINQLMRQIWARIENGSYIGYTATPFANVFMDPNSENRSELAELYPKNFVHVMPTPSNYFGAERIFGLDGGSAHHETPDVIRTVPETELRQLAPKSEEPAVTASLEEALRWFIVAAAVRRARGQQSKHSTMLIHTTHRVDPHFEMRDAVQDFLAPLKREAREGDVESFREVFHREMDRSPELYTGDGAAVSWPRVQEEIPNVLRQLRLSVDNGKADAEQRLTYPESPQTVVVIGGGTLSRGLTLEGLFVSFFTRTSNTYDTLLQMGRWFGYRPGYEDLQRIWLSPGLDDDYRFLATVEAEVREEVARLTATNQTPEQIGLRVSLHPGRLQVTNPAKMKHVDVAQADFEGFRLQTTRFDVSDGNMVERNVEVTDRLRKSLLDHRQSADSHLYKDVPVSELRSFFEDFAVHKRFQQTFRDAFRWSSEQMADKTWNVVIPHDDGRYRTVSRSPIFEAPNELRAKQELNIRALMTQGDILADLRHLDPEEFDELRASVNREQLLKREEPTGINGRGLLVVYPISRSSRARDARTRMDMESALRTIDPNLVHATDRPLMGVAMIAPMDTEHKLKTKGTTVAVSPAFGQGEDVQDDVVADSEGDFSGGEV